MKYFNFIENGYKVGDKVWNFIDDRWEEIIEISESLGYPIVTEDSTYTKDGRYFISDIVPTIYPNEFKLELPPEAFRKHLPSFKVNQPLWVYDGRNDDLVRRHFQRLTDDGFVMCFRDGESGWTNPDNEGVMWRKWKLPTKEELKNFPGDWEYEGK